MQRRRKLETSHLARLTSRQMTKETEHVSLQTYVERSPSSSRGTAEFRSTGQQRQPRRPYRCKEHSRGWDQ